MESCSSVKFTQTQYQLLHTTLTVGNLVVSWIQLSLILSSYCTISCPWVRMPPCARDHRAVVLSCSHLARRWAVLERRSAWLVEDGMGRVWFKCSLDTECRGETHSLSRASKIYWHNAFQIKHTHILVLSTVVVLHYSAPHTLWGSAVKLALVLTPVKILADAPITQPSPIWPTSRPAIAGNPRCKNITAKSVHLTSVSYTHLTLPTSLRV